MLAAVGWNASSTAASQAAVRCSISTDVPMAAARRANTSSARYAVRLNLRSVHRRTRVTRGLKRATATSVEYFLNVRFERPGTYWIEILLDGDLKLRYPLKAGVAKRRT